MLLRKSTMKFRGHGGAARSMDPDDAPSSTDQSKQSSHSLWAHPTAQSGHARKGTPSVVYVGAHCCCCRNMGREEFNRMWHSHVVRIIHQNQDSECLSGASCCFGSLTTRVGALRYERRPSNAPRDWINIAYDALYSLIILYGLYLTTLCTAAACTAAACTPFPGVYLVEGQPHGH